MTSKQTINLIGMIALAFLYGVAIYLIPADMLGPTGAQNIADFMDVFHKYMLVVAGVSFGCALTWFAVGGWGIKPWTPARTWYLTWTLLLLVIVLTATVMCFEGPKGNTPDPVNFGVAPFYVLSGVLYFYLATVLFSPTHAMYLIWPAKLVRRW